MFNPESGPREKEEPITPAQPESEPKQPEDDKKVSRRSFIKKAIAGVMAGAALSETGCEPGGKCPDNRTQEEKEKDPQWVEKQKTWQFVYDSCHRISQTGQYVFAKNGEELVIPIGKEHFYSVEEGWGNISRLFHIANSARWNMEKAEKGDSGGGLADALLFGKMPGTGGTVVERSLHWENSDKNKNVKERLAEIQKKADDEMRATIVESGREVDKKYFQETLKKIIEKEKRAKRESMRKEK
jgi:hypothetical protein